MTTFETLKDPDAVVPYDIDWSATLNAFSPNDTISTSTWSADGVTVDSNSKTTTVASVVISGGTNYSYATLTNQIVTAAGYTYDRTIVLAVQTR